MKYNEFYREPVAKLISATPLSLIELSARNCYDSFGGVKLDIKGLYAEYDEDIYDIPNRDTLSKLRKKHGRDYDAIRVDLIEYGLLFDYTNYIIPNTKFIREIGINKNHSSILEHGVLHFRLEFPRNVLQEISRHRVGVSPSIKSTRYTLTRLKKLYDETPINNVSDIMLIKNNYSEIKQYLHDNYGVRGKDMINSTDEYFFALLNDLYLANDNKLSNDFLKNILPEHWWTVGHYTINLRSFKHMMDLRLNKSAFMPFRRLAYEMYEQLPSDYKEIFKDDYKVNLESINNKWLNEDM